jgi:nitrite reductase (NO-forming)
VNFYLKFCNRCIFILLFVTFFSVFAFSTELSKDEQKKANQLFIDQCSKCHRKDGKGIIGVYPPIKNADYIKNNDTQELLRGMLFGRSGKLTVNGVTYNGVMITEIDKSITDEDTALMLTYIYQNLNGIKKSVTAKEVKQARKAGKLPPHK